MEKYNRGIFVNYKPSAETFEKALLLTSKLGKLNTRMRDLFYDPMVPSRLFAFVESKYSSKIEGIYTTLFDVVNTGLETKQEKIIGPLVNSLLASNKLIDREKIEKLGTLLTEGMDKSKRFKKEFGVWDHKNEVKIYEPLLDEADIKAEMNLFWKNISDKDTNVIDAIKIHIWFEKIHPFVDGNGRVGRLLLNRQLSKVTNFSNLLPFSWTIFKNRNDYYESFELSNSSLDKGIQKMLDIILFMYDKVKGFIKDLKTLVKDNLEAVMKSSTRMTEEIAKRIILTLQTKQSYLIKEYKLNPRTISNIFRKINASIDFNEKIIGREKAFWNIELEGLIDKWFGE